ncbi:MAG TPA: prolyl oligopeptidase family serine peptidase, partial [Thermomicrobiales bacterium]|nr:prolyl oligopeptidase family serine peptidase [Thermomicrobiales bacterium]
WDYPRWSIPEKEAGRAFFFKNDGLQNQAVLYVTLAPDAEPVELLDPNALSEDGTVAVTAVSASDDGRLLGYALAEAGSDWQRLRVRVVDERDDLPDLIRWCKFSPIAWTRDSAGFFYSRFPEPGTVAAEDANNYNTVYYHRIGDQQAQDTLIYERPDEKELHFHPTVTHDGSYLVITAVHGTDPRARIYYREIDGDGSVIPLIEEADAKYEFIDNDGPVFLFLTDLDAPRGRVIAIDTRQPAREHWREVIAEGEHPLAFVVAAGERLVVVRMRDAQHRLALHQRDGSFDREVDLPGIGSIESISGKPSDPELFVAFTSFLYPTTPFRLDLANAGATLEPLHESGIDFDTSAYETTQVFYASKDGTRVPMFLTHKRGLTLDGSNPTLLYGYGGFNISLTPSFAIHRLAWLEAGGVYALANLRGGEEYGEEWHQAGMLEKKQNVFDDFIAAAEWLIDNGYTSRAKLAINGGSNGGLLTGACLTQRPDLYGAVVCEVPVTDMLRFHKFTVGHYWVPEYGNAETNSEHFRFMLAYSPLHNVREGVAYPPTLITSADTDDRVVPAHAKKFAATLQAAQSGDNPILIRIETRAGHGLGKPTSKIIAERADVYAFLFDILGIDA